MRTSWDNTRRVSPLFVGLLRFSLLLSFSLSTCAHLKPREKEKKERKNPRREILTSFAVHAFASWNLASHDPLLIYSLPFGGKASYGLTLRFPFSL